LITDIEKSLQVALGTKVVHVYKQLTLLFANVFIVIVIIKLDGCLGSDDLFIGL
jgi:hypothetical protein